MVVMSNYILIFHKLRLITSFLIIKYSIILLIYSMNSADKKTASISILSIEEQRNEGIYE